MLEWKNIVVDWLFEKPAEFNNFYTLLKRFRRPLILVYCPFKKLEQRILKRIQKGDNRFFSYVFKQFGRLYKDSENNSDPILGTLTKETVLRLCEKHVRPELEKYKEDYKKYIDKLLTQLNLHNKTKIRVTPRYKHDFIVNSGTHNTHECALQIKKFLESGKKLDALRINSLTRNN